MNKFLHTTFILLIVSLTTFAQKYGNEWIDYSLKYSKITVNKDDLYKITFNETVSKNLSAGKLDPKKFQLFNKGAEVPIFISGDQDGSFDQGDELFFYGSKNDASLDKILYANKEDVPNNEVSLFTDDNYYFLTYNPNKNGLRYKISNLSQTNLTPEQFIVVKARLNFDTNYYPGQYILDVMSLSEYIAGEGYLGATIAKGQSLNYQLNTPSFVNTGYQSKLSFYVAGRSNSSSTNILGRNHHFRVSKNSTPLFDSLYRGYATIRKEVPIDVTSNTTNLTLSSVDDLGAVTDFQAPGYLQIQYGRNLNMNGVNNLSFSVEKNKAFCFLSFTNLSMGKPIILEKQGLNAYTNSGGNSFVLKEATTLTDYYLADQNTATEATGDVLLFKDINSASSRNYLIISHKSLQAGAEAYQQYNESISMPTSVVYTDDLYNEFYYGFHHSMALRNYCKFVIETGSIKPEYLLLLGKGYEQSREYLNDDLVPTMGFPGSDNMITSGLNGSNLEPGLATGRIPARTNNGVVNYLNKLKVYNALGNDLWRKKILQVSGGKSIGEVSSFAAYQNNLYNIASVEKFGATRSRVFKNVSTPITENQSERIIKETQDGIGLLSYLGHGSATGTEISFGKATDQINKTNPTIYLVNGCSTGQCFTNVSALSEDFILAKEVGAVAWIGTSSEGVASYLGSVSARFHQNWFDILYGKSVAKGFKEGLRTFQNQNDVLNLAHTRQYIYLGDPYLKFFSNDKVDYNIQPTYLFQSEANQNATSEFLNLSLKIENLGKAINDSVSIKIQRILENNAVANLQEFRIKPVYNQDTIAIKLSNIGHSVSGINRITVSLNYDNTIDEENFANNSMTSELFLPGNGVRTLLPIERGIVSTPTFALKAQPDDLFTKNAEYLFEVDTTINFNSNFIARSPIVNAGVFPEWTPNIILEDGKVYFWRVRLNVPVDRGGSWTSSSFTYLENTLDGYSLGDKSQLTKLTLDNLNFSTETGKFEFAKNFFTTSITTMGDQAPNPSTKRFRTTQAVDFGTPLFEGITLVAMNNLTPNKFFSYPSPYNSTNGPMTVNGYTGQYFFNTNDPIQVDSLIRYVSQIPKGYHVIGLNGRNATINQLSDKAKLALQSFGLTKYNIVGYGEPYMFWGIKGEINDAVEFTADYTSTVPPNEQTLQYFNDLEYSLSSGSFTTDAIGPFEEWSDLNVSFETNSFDNISYDIIGVTNGGSQQVLMSNIDENNISLKNISAKDYPFIKVKTSVQDATEFNFPKLNRITIIGKPFSDFSFDTDFVHQFKSKRIQEGDSVKWDIGLRNTLKYETDTVMVSYSIINESQKTTTGLIQAIPPVKVGETIKINIKESTLNLVGKNTIKISLNSKTNDQYSFNNKISYDFLVEKDMEQSIINVRFDGRNIINGDIVSPMPSIQISNTDDNKFLLLNDTASVEVYFKKGTNDDFKRISYSGNLLTFTAPNSNEKNEALVEFKPERLTDGLYTLKVKGKDVNGNQSANDYFIDFEVVNESSITNFYPYPNPVVNSMRFVFTLTGVKIPDKIKITIYNSSGKVVRTVLKPELGNIKIGNNVSDFTWDGTDQFGDRLANGVYFYKVQTSDNDENFKGKNTYDSNKFFKAQTGKIYLLR